jgi:hypothetical protein
MPRLEGEHTLLRVFTGENNSYKGQPLYRAIVEMLRKEGLAGATVLRGICGFGATSVLHTSNLLRLSQDLPLVIEVVDSRENIDRILPILDEMIGEGLVTMERVGVVRYGPKGKT